MQNQLEEKTKYTQGNKKLKQYIEDLYKNKNFISLYKQIIYKSNRKKGEELLKYLSEKYGVNWELFLIIKEALESENFKWRNEFDVCDITDSYDLIDYEIRRHHMPIKKDIARFMHMASYPVNIEINKLASKRDVLDFIEKKWDIIDSYLEAHRKKPIRIRRRNKQKIYDFIWDLREKNNNVKKIKIELDNKFPGNKLVYYEIHKIINLEKKRRYKDIAIGF